jgi:hypothetical protein
MELEPTVLTHQTLLFPKPTMTFFKCSAFKNQNFQDLLKLGPDFPFSSFQLLTTLTHNINIGSLSLGALLGYFMRV